MSKLLARIKSRLYAAMCGSNRFPAVYNLRDYTMNRYIRLALKAMLLPFATTTKARTICMES